MNMSDKGLYLCTALLAFGLLMAGCSKEAPNGANGPKGEAPAQSLKPVAVRTAVAEARTVERSVEAVGTLHPFDEVTVSNEVPGIVDKIEADLGDRVKAGATLMVLDQREAQLNLDEAEAAYKTAVKGLERERARLNDARSTLKRNEELFAKEMVSASAFDNIKTQFEVAEAQLNEAQARIDQAKAKVNLSRKRLSDTVVKSPISGAVVKRSVSVGEALKDKTSSFVVASTATLKFRGTVPEGFVARVKEGQEVAINVEAYKDKTFKGIIKRMSPAVDPSTRTLEIEAIVPNDNALLKPGFFARGDIKTEKEAGVTFVPESAVYTFVGITKVFVIKDGRAFERQVKTGVRDGGLIEVTGEVKPGDTVSITGLAGLFEGAEVTVAPDVAATGPAAGASLAKPKIDEAGQKR